MSGSEGYEARMVGKPGDWVIQSRELGTRTSQTRTTDDSFGIGAPDRVVCKFPGSMALHGPTSM